MINQSIKKSRAKIIFLILVIISISLFVINFIPIFVVNEGITTEFSGNLIYDREAYVNKSDPDMNYQIYEWQLIIGNSCETYIHFNLESLPEEVDEIHFFMYPNYPFEDIEINLIFVDSNWSSSDITWNNKPKHEEIVDTVNASEIWQGPLIIYYDFNRTVNLTEFIRSNLLKELSLCINITKNYGGLTNYFYLQGIQLIWNYEKLLLSYTTIITSYIISFMLIGMILYNQKGIYHCPSCRRKGKLTHKICPYCGNHFKEDFIIRAADNQLILIHLWIFALLEGCFLIWASQYYYYIIGPILNIFLITNWSIICSIQIGFKIKKYKRIRFFLK
jgi:hypothetical protein